MLHDELPMIVLPDPGHLNDREGLCFADASVEYTRRLMNLHPWFTYSTPNVSLWCNFIRHKRGDASDAYYDRTRVRCVVLGCRLLWRQIAINLLWAKEEK